MREKERFLDKFETTYWRRQKDYSVRVQTILPVRVTEFSEGRRLSRLTLPFSKKLENFKAPIALHLAYDNFVKTHRALRSTPAIEAGIEKGVWTVSDLVNAA
jgi:hypothetical protein